MEKVKSLAYLSVELLDVLLDTLLGRRHGDDAMLDSHRSSSENFLSKLGFPGRLRSEIRREPAPPSRVRDAVTRQLT
jgi:hypothetical protein